MSNLQRPLIAKITGKFCRSAGASSQEYNHHDVKKIHENMHEKVAERAKLRFLPLMAWCCDGQNGAVNAESFAERIISCAFLTMADSNTLLNDKALRIFFVLRMKRIFMLFMRENYFLEIKALKPFNMAVVVPDLE